MASIGSITGLVFLDQLVRAQIDSRLVVSTGVNGYGVVWDAWRAPPQTMRTVQTSAVIVSIATDIASIEDAYRNLIQTAVTVTDQFGVSWTNTLVVSAVPTFSVLVNGDIETACEWRLIVTSGAPS